MLGYGRIGASKGINVNKTNESHTFIICNYYYFLKVNFRFQPKARQRCHDLIRFNDVAIVFVEGNGYKIHFFYISKDEAINIMKNSDLKEKRGSL